jgi:hypothetical protein
MELSFKSRHIGKVLRKNQKPEVKNSIRQAQGDSKFNVIVSLSNLDTDKV